MAKVYRRHRYYGIKLFMRQLGRQLLKVSGPLVWLFMAVYLILPIFLPLEKPGKLILAGIGILSLPCAYMWNKAYVKFGSSMDIIAAGHDGEGQVAKVLAKLPRGWAILNNLALRVGGPIVQIDHLVISPAGVYVLETKAQKGRIIASPKTGKWQVNRRGEIRAIANPVEQNQAQVEACKYLLKEVGMNVPCRGLIVMTEANARSAWTIVQAKELQQYLTAQNTETVINPGQIRRLAKSLLSFQVSGKASWQKGHEPLWFFALTVMVPFLVYMILLLILLNTLR